MAKPRFHAADDDTSRSIPVEAVRLLEGSEASGRLAVYFNWGEYALYHVYPEIRVSIDGRYETAYPDDVVQANWDFTRDAPGG